MRILCECGMTIPEYVEDCEKRAREVFKDHKIQREDRHQWYVGRIGRTTAYHYRLIFSPRSVYLYGDIGTLVLIPSESDSFKWLKATFENEKQIPYDYILGKSPEEYHTKVFLMKEAYSWIKNQRNSLKKELHTEIKELRSLDLSGQCDEVSEISAKLENLDAFDCCFRENVVKLEEDHGICSALQAWLNSLKENSLITSNIDTIYTVPLYWDSIRIFQVVALQTFIDIYKENH